MRLLGSFDPTGYHLAIRVIARSVLVATVILFLPWLRAALPDRSAAAALEPAPAAGRDAAQLLTLLGDLRRQGLLGHDDRAVLVGNTRYELPLLKRSRIDPIEEQFKPAVADRTVDFALVADIASDPDLAFVDRVLKVGGIVTVRLDSGQFRMPANYRIVYVRQFGSTVVAVKKIAHAAANVADSAAAPLTGRRLLAAAEPKKETLLNPHTLRGLRKYRKRGRCCPELMGHSLNDYSIHVFVDVDLSRNGRNTWWFIKKYLTLNWEFGIAKLNMMPKGRVEDGVTTARLASTVKEERKAARWTDELFLECIQQWEKGKKGVMRNKRSYWECLALCGKLEYEGFVSMNSWGMTQTK